MSVRSGLATRKSVRGMVLVFAVGVLMGALGLLYAPGQAQQSDPHYGQLQTAQPANLSFQSLSGCASEYFMLDSTGGRTALTGQAANINIADLRVAAVQLEFQSTGGCRVVIDLSAKS